MNQKNPFTFKIWKNTETIWQPTQAVWKYGRAQRSINKNKNKLNDTMV